MAYRRKADAILLYKPDILIILECEHPDKLNFIDGVSKHSDILWYGENQNKGICIFAFGKYKLKLLASHNPDIKVILPIKITGGVSDFTLFAVWAFNPFDPSYRYIGQVWKAIIYYEQLLNGGNVIIAGDFNSNVLWDKLKRRVSHTMVVEKLASLKIYSAYHSYYGFSQGSEEHPTFFMYRHVSRAYHIDYCFASQDIISKLAYVEVGDHEAWSKYSDHSPLISLFTDL